MFLDPLSIRNIDPFHLVLAYLFIFIRNLIISIKYGYFRPEDFALLGEDPPKWTEENTSRRLVGASWSNPSQFPGLVEDELICTMDESDVVLQGMSFRVDESSAERMRAHSTDELFSAKTDFKDKNEITAGFVVHLILSKIYNRPLPNICILTAIFSVLTIILIPIFSKLYFGNPVFGENAKEIFISITLILGFFWAIPVFIFGLISIHDFSRRYLSIKMLGDLMIYPGRLLKDFLYFPKKQDHFLKSFNNIF